MNERVARLRERSVTAATVLSLERARLVTEFDRHVASRVLPAPAYRGELLRYLFEHKEIRIEEDELIVGERGPWAKAVPTYPEICCHGMQDLEVLDQREKVSYRVDSEARRIQEEIVIPVWQGRSMRDRILRHMQTEWLEAYEAGIFTEFMEQRAPGHTALGDVIYRKGLQDLKAEAAAALEKLDMRATDSRAPQRRDELLGMMSAADAVIRYAERYAHLALSMANKERDPIRRKELRRIAEVCSWVPAHAPRTFWEALQAYWFTHLGVVTELNPWDAFSPGRLDQHLAPFYAAGLADGSLTREAAIELLECLWVKFNNQPAPPKVGVTAEESSTYTDFCNINVGGLRPDGSDGVNDVSYLLLDVIDDMRLVQPSSNIQLSSASPDAFLRRAAEIIRQGWGQPSVFNADAVVQELMRQGKSVIDARMGGTSGCVEAGAFGREAYILTGYLNVPKILEVTLNDGVDPRTGKLVGLRSGNPRDFSTYEQLYAAFRMQLRRFLDIKMRGSAIIERSYAEEMPAPFLSLLIEDCIEKGCDYNGGGARYNSTYIQIVGMGTATDTLAALKTHVYERRDVTMDGVLAALNADFAGYEETRLRLWNRSPKYGNDDPAADDIVAELFDTIFDEIDGQPNGRAGAYHVNYLSTTCHVYFGSVTGATPDGRKASQPLSDGISPAQGADHHGPAAVIRSAARLDHLRTGGTLLNQKFTPQLLEDDAGLEGLMSLVRAYFKMGGHHLQFNVVTAEALKEAQRDPDKHRDLIVRVAGYSDYFCDLSRALQDEIIARTEQVAV